jgi:hypothetical protein
MPPAFVLSQDQTLKFIPGPTAADAPDNALRVTHAPPRPAPHKGLQNARKCANVRTPPSISLVGRRPRIPSIFHNLNQQTQPGNNPNRVMPKGAALITPAILPSQPVCQPIAPTIFERAIFLAGRPRRTANMATPAPLVQTTPTKIPPPTHPPHPSDQPQPPQLQQHPRHPRLRRRRPRNTR